MTWNWTFTYNWTISALGLVIYLFQYKYVKYDLSPNTKSGWYQQPLSGSPILFGTLSKISTQNKFRKRMIIIKNFIFLINFKAFNLNFTPFRPVCRSTLKGDLCVSAHLVWSMLVCLLVTFIQSFSASLAKLGRLVNLAVLIILSKKL